MTLPLMPKATAVWLVENTTLSFEQIALFCGLHPLEVQGIADGDVAAGLVGQNPVSAGLITQASLDAAIADPKVEIKLKSDVDEYITDQQKHKARYTPVARRQDKPDAIAWLLKNHPELSDAQIVRLIGTTKNTLSAVRDKTHWNTSNIRPRDPVLLSLCTQTDLHAAIDKVNAAKEKATKDAEKKAKKAADSVAKADKATTEKAEKAAKTVAEANEKLAENA